MEKMTQQVRAERMKDLEAAISEARQKQIKARGAGDFRGEAIHRMNADRHLDEWSRLKREESN